MRSRSHMVSVMATAMLATSLPLISERESRSVRVTNKAKAPADSADRMARAEAKRLRKNAKRLPVSELLPRQESK